jgi:hypothetical protein
MGETTLPAGLKQLRTTGFQQLSILNPGRADGLASPAAQASINMKFEGRRICGEFVFLNRAHQVDSSAWAVVLVASEDIGRTRFEAQTAVHTRK